MYTQDQILHLLKKKKPELEQKYLVSELALFGSYARGDYRPDSDIDILVDFRDNIDAFAFIRLAHELQDLFQHKTDVVSRGGIRSQYLPFVEKNLIHVWKKHLVAIPGHGSFHSKIMVYTQGQTLTGYQQNSMMKEAVERNFEIIGEAAGRIPVAVQMWNSDIEWRITKDFRNVIIHDYFGINNEIVCNTIQHRLPELLEQINRLIADVPQSET